MQLEGLGERCKLPQRSLGRSPSGNRIWCILSLQCDIGGSSFTNYRAMHSSAKRGIALACRPSVRLSVTLVDQEHIRWES